MSSCSYVADITMIAIMRSSTKFHFALEHVALCVTGVLARKAVGIGIYSKLTIAVQDCKMCSKNPSNF